MSTTALPGAAPRRKRTGGPPGARQRRLTPLQPYGGAYTARRGLVGLVLIHKENRK